MVIESHRGARKAPKAVSKRSCQPGTWSHLLILKLLRVRIHCLSVKRGKKKNLSVSITVESPEKWSQLPSGRCQTAASTVKNRAEKTHAEPFDLRVPTCGSKTKGQNNSV